MMHLHLDPLGGLAGDMFAACILSAFPEHAAAVADAARRAAGTECRPVPHDDGVLAGQRFVVLGADGEPADPPSSDRSDHGHHHHHNGHHHDHDHGHDHGHDHAHHHGHDHDHHGHAEPAPGAAHGHRAWRDIRAHLERCGLPAPVRDHAIGIFAVLADAEGRVHGKAAADVVFHEVGNADSISDIVAAAVLIDATGAAGWSVSALPLGSGRIRTAHGVMPVPAPATALLLDGFACIDDGIDGERVTPTGAAILAYLHRSGRLRPRPSGQLGRSGIGFGTRRLPGTSNCVRLLAIETGSAAGHGAEAGGAPHRTLSVISFEVDDQSGEDLAAGLDRIRGVNGVHDVVQMIAVGKKGRIATHVQVLAAPDALESVVEACFSETTTIGLRTHEVQGRALRRRIETALVDGVPVGVKLVRRAQGETGKAEADHVLSLPTHAARDERRRRAVSAALASAPDAGADR